MDIKTDSKAEQAEAPAFNLDPTPISGWGQQPIGMSTTLAKCPACHGTGAIGIPGAPCPFCKIHELVNLLGKAEPVAPVVQEVTNSMRTLYQACLAAWGPDDLAVHDAKSVLEHLENAAQPPQQPEASVAGERLALLKKQSDGSGSLAAHQAYINGLEFELRAALASKPLAVEQENKNHDDS